MWSDKDVRYAFDMAIDRKLIIDTLYQGTAAAIPTGYFGHPSIDGYDASLGQPVYDPARAKELLANSTYDGRMFELLVAGNTAQYEQLAMTVQNMLTAAGFSLEVTLETAANTISRMNNGDYDVFLNIGSFPDGIIQRQVTRVVNDTDKCSYQKDDLMAAIRGYLSEVDAAKRKEYARQVNKIVFEDKAPHITLMHRSIIHAQNYGIKGVVYPPDGVFSHVYIDWDPSLIP
jgi:ABC-type transport system substrate-binding protein